MEERELGDRNVLRVLLSIQSSEMSVVNEKVEEEKVGRWDRWLREQARFSQSISNRE